MAIPIPTMLGDLLHFHEDVVGYVARWREHLASFGGHVSASYEEDGSQCLMVGSKCDAQVRHRSRWLHFLCEDLKKDVSRREHLIATLVRDGHYIDNRAANPRQTTTTIRDYLRMGGRLLITPEGELSEGGGLPRAFIDGTPEALAECIRAGRAYYEMSRRWRSQKQIKRAVRLLGHRTDNGWMVLEAPA
jgi:hypothetical protein